LAVGDTVAVALTCRVVLTVGEGPGGVGVAVDQPEGKDAAVGLATVVWEAAGVFSAIAVAVGVVSTLSTVVGVGSATLA
jgi:hypothetical protein